MSLALQIVAALAVCYLLYVFGSGLITAIGAEYEWSRGRRIRGGRAILFGFGMMLCAPLGVALAVGIAKLGLFGKMQNEISVGIIITAILYWAFLRAMTQRLDVEEN